MQKIRRDGRDADFFRGPKQSCHADKTHFSRKVGVLWLSNNAVLLAWELNVRDFLFFVLFMF